jgi:hypothetical protein
MKQLQNFRQLNSPARNVLVHKSKKKNYAVHASLKDFWYRDIKVKVIKMLRELQWKKMNVNER